MYKYIITILLVSIIPLSQATAQEICGQVLQMRRLGDAERFCNSYDRQLAYREERIKFREAIDQRREDFYTPYHDALKQYEEDMKALNEERNHQDDIIAR